MECDAREKYTFYVRINDEHGVKKILFISISQAHISNSLICTVLCVSPANFFFLQPTVNSLPLLCSVIGILHLRYFFIRKNVRIRSPITMILVKSARMVISDQTLRAPMGNIAEKRHNSTDI